MQSGKETDQDEFMGERMCIVTRETLPADEMIRFVGGPDGSIVPDLKRVLPGRGCSVKAERSLLEKAVKKNIFARALKKDVKPAADLADQVDRLLVVNLTGMMNMARKAGQFVSGSMKVDNAVRAGEALAVFHASDAAADGVRKISQARKAWMLAMEEPEEPPAFQLMSYEEMQELMGDNAFIHAVALAGQAGEGVVKRAKLLETYRGGSSG
jgi:predicted RNA-binding protein YlxR (DUF448 family)